MPVGTTVLVSLAVIATVGAGFGLGRWTAPDASDALAEQTEAVRAVAEGNKALVAEVQEVARLDAAKEAEIASKLTDVPVTCLPELGGSVNSAECLWALCVRTGETDAQRCDQSEAWSLLKKSRDLDGRSKALDDREASLDAVQQGLIELEEALGLEGCPEPPK